MLSVFNGAVFIIKYLLITRVSNTLFVKILFQKIYYLNKQISTVPQIYLLIKQLILFYFNLAI